MTLFNTSMLLLALSIGLMTVGFSAREYRWGPGLMMLGIGAALSIIAYNILIRT